MEFVFTAVSDYIFNLAVLVMSAGFIRKCSKFASHQNFLMARNASTCVSIQYSMYSMYSVSIQYTVCIVGIVCILYSIYSIYTIYSIYSIYSRCSIYGIYSMYSIVLQGLKERLEDLIPKKQAQVKEFRKGHGSTVVGEVTVDMMYGGMRGITGKYNHVWLGTTSSVAR